MLESKKSFNLFRKSSDPQYQEVAETDKRIYDFFLNRYVKNAA